MRTEQIIEKYHFEREAEDRIKELSSALTYAVNLRMRYKEGEFAHGAILAGITLGDGPDRLCEAWMRDGSLTDAYMADCILCEMLVDAYGAFCRQFHRDTGRYITYMKFIGDMDIPADHLKEALRMLEMEEIRCTGGGMMAPSKSVVFYAGASAEKPETCSSICANCGNKMCERRQR